MSRPSVETARPPSSVAAAPRDADDAGRAVARRPAGSRPTGLRRLGGRWFLLGVAVTLVLLGFSVAVGQYDAFSADGFWMVGITRIPRTIGLILAGASMAMCGLIMQLLTQNRFVEPTTTGTTEWAGLGLLLVMIVAPQASLTVKMLGATTMAFLGTMVFFLFLRRVSLRSSLVVPIIGLMLGAVVGSISTYLALMTDMLQTLGIWFAGSFTSVIRGQYEVLWIVLVVAVLIFFVADQFTVAGLGKETATSVGLNHGAVVLLGTAMVAVATGVTATVVGTLPFLGLVVPNLVSMIRGDDLRSNLPWVCLAGISVVTACDLLGRTVRAPFEVPVGLVLGLVGSVVFVVLLLVQRRRGVIST
ncbi:iron chelate uptake ABC transporter family permease subunit [Nesterenkonia sp. F]|uniref:ABC transporter permease n=1 Tax=Nesterenkonia sp. F TaxID=795955 RepID=UPI000255D37C